MPLQTVTETIKAPSNPVPTYAATDLTQGGGQAQIVFEDKTYTLRITRAGKLILTK